MTGRTGCQRPRQKLQASMRLHKELDPPRRKRRSPKTMLVRKERGPGGLSVPRCSPSSCSELGWSRARRPVLEGAGGLREQSLRTGTRAHLTRLLFSFHWGLCEHRRRNQDVRVQNSPPPPPPLCKKIGFSAYSADGICPEESRAHFIKRNYDPFTTPFPCTVSPTSFPPYPAQIPLPSSERSLAPLSFHRAHQVRAFWSEPTLLPEPQGPNVTRGK